MTFSSLREVPLLLHRASARMDMPGAGLHQRSLPPGSLPSLSVRHEHCSLSFYALPLLYTDLNSRGTPCEHLAYASSMCRVYPLCWKSSREQCVRNSWSQGLVCRRAPLQRLEGEEMCSLLSMCSPDPLILMKKCVSCCYSPATFHP